MAFDSSAPTAEPAVALMERVAEEAPHPEAAKAVAKVAGAFRVTAEDSRRKRAAIRAGGEDAPGLPGPAPRKKAIEGAKRAAIKRALDGGEDPLEIMLDNARWAFRRARDAEKTLEGGVESGAVLREVIAFRELAQGCAVAAAPYLHSKLAPKIPKGETGLTVNLVIEDA